MSMQSALQIALLPKDVMFFNMMAFNGISKFYSYSGTKQLVISKEDLQKVLNHNQTTYNNLKLNEERRHFERIHEKFTDPGAYPVITVYNDEKQSTEFLSPISEYDHPRYTSNISYTFNPEFIKFNNEFNSGYRTVCIDVLNALVSKYSRLFFVYLSGNMQEFHFGEKKLRELLNITGKYSKRAAILPILDCVQKELKELGIEFDYSYCTEAEWKAYKWDKDNQKEGPPVAVPGQNNKKKNHFKNFWFRAKGVEQYRIPKGVQSIFSRDLALNNEYAIIRNYFNRELRMSDNFMREKWGFVTRYIDLYGAKNLIDFADKKIKQLAKQKKKPHSPNGVLLSCIINKVKESEADRRGEQTIFSVPDKPDTDRYDPRGKTAEEIKRDIDNYLLLYENSS